MQPRGDVTRLLKDLSAGRQEAREELIPLVYRELHALAEFNMRSRKPGHTLQTTALVNEAYLRMIGKGGASFESRVHFLRVAARAMRSVLVDHDRHRRALRRGGDQERRPLIAIGALDDDGAHPHDLLDLDAALCRLSEADPQTGQVVELRYFAGLTIEETAEALGLSGRTVRRKWTLARAWLRRELTDGKAERPADASAHDYED